MTRKRTRAYIQTRRADQQADTRRRIVEATVDLHSKIGPALTTISMVAERAGVQRHTVYAHFPDERSLHLACSGLAMERGPLPDAAPWEQIADRGERLRVGLEALYGWYERNAELAACVLRDAEFHPLTREIIDLRMGPQMQHYRNVLGEGLTARQRAMLQLALSFHTWRTLTRDDNLSRGDAAAAMASAIAGMGG
jgi:AcrR family transcriptional regulator